MRVISGSARGKKLTSLQGDSTRPTLDRVKEALFNILQFKIRDTIILDLFSGSGALAIEALSRGAKHAIVCDNSKEAIKIINKNLQETRLMDKAQIICTDYMETLKKITNQNIKFDIIFLDPPYKTNYLENSINTIIKNELLNQDGIIVLETDDENKIENIKKIENIEIYDKRKYGIVNIVFVRKG